MVPFPQPIALSLPQVAWAVAGSAIGLLLVGLTATAATLLFGRRDDRTRASLWVRVSEALELLQSDPDDTTARALVLSALNADDGGEELRAVTSVLSHCRDERVLERIGDSDLEERLLERIADADPHTVRDALTMAGLLGVGAALPVVLMRCEDNSGDTRRVATTVLARLTPTMAFERLVTRVSSEGPWAAELLARLARDGVTDPWLRTKDRPERTRLDLINLLASLLTDDSPQRALSAVSILGEMDHRLARVALASGLQSGHVTVEHAAAGALLESNEGRQILEDLRSSATVAGSALSSELLTLDTADEPEAGRSATPGRRELHLFAR